MATGAVIDADKTIDTAVQRLLRPVTTGDIVIDRDPGGMRPVNDPAWITQRRHQERHLFLQGDIEPLMDPLQVGFRTLLDNQIHADRFTGKTADVAQAFAELMAMHITQAQRLHNADAARFRDRRHQLRIRAGVHGPADQRYLDAQRLTECGMSGH